MNSAASIAGIPPFHTQRNQPLSSRLRTAATAPQQASSSLQQLGPVTSATQQQTVAQTPSPSSQPSNSSLNTNIDVANMSEEDRTNLRKVLLEQLTERIAIFQRIKVVWIVVYYVLGLVGLLSNIGVVVLSSLSLSALVPSTESVLVSTILSVVGGVAFSLNGFLQTRMNVVYFSEALGKYYELQMSTWSDLAFAVRQFETLNATYDSSGVGTLVTLDGFKSFFGSSSSSSTHVAPIPATSTSSLGSMGVRDSSELFHKQMPKQYAYPKKSSSPRQHKK